MTPRVAPNGRWQHRKESGGTAPASLMFGAAITILNIIVGTFATFMGEYVMGAVMFVMALFVIWTLWEERR